MTRPPPEEDADRLRPISATLVAWWGIAGLAGGFALRRVADVMGRPAPAVTWVQALALVLGALILGYVAWATRRTTRRLGARPPAHQMVNRLVLARACALVGALLAGGYAGHLVSWLGDPSAVAGERILRSAVAALAGLGIVGFSLLLERACRVPPDDDAAEG